MVESFVVSFCKMYESFLQLVLFCWFYISFKKNDGWYSDNAQHISEILYAAYAFCWCDLPYFFFSKNICVCVFFVLLITDLYCIYVFHFLYITVLYCGLV